MSVLAEIKKGDTVILHMFTGIAVGVKEVIAADKNTVTLETRIGKAKFSRKTGKQVEPEAKSEKYSNFVTEDDGSFVPKSAKKAETKKVDKKADKKKKAAEPEEEEEAKPAKKVKKAEKPVEKKAVKKSKKASDDDDDYEEVE